MMRVEPLDQRATGVQRELQLWVAFEQVQKRMVAVLIGLLKHAVEITDRLMIVKHKQEADRMRHRGGGRTPMADGGSLELSAS